MSLEENNNPEEKATYYETEWLKIGNITYMTFVGSNVVAFGKGCYIILYNITTKEEVIYEANKKSMGEGVQCLVGYQQGHMFAFAEMSPYPRIFLVKYPTLEHVCVLQDLNIAHTYAAMSFGEMECLVCLTGVPTFEIIVWCWRTGDKLAHQATGIICSELSLRCSVSMPIGVSLLANSERDSIFQLWQINICSKLCLLSKTELLNGGLDEHTFISSFCWSPDGLLLVADTAGNLYLVKEELERYVKVLNWPYKLREGASIVPTNILWYKDGVVMSGPNKFIQFIKKVSNTEFTPGWCITNEGPLLVMATNRARNELVGFSSKLALQQLQVTEQSATLNNLKYYGSPVRLFSFIHPLDKYYVTISTRNILETWEKKTGVQVGMMELFKGFVLDMDCNPVMPYLAMGRSDGFLQIVAVTEGEPFQIAEMSLCSEEITGVIFNAHGTLIVAASYKIGRIFVTQGLVGTGHKINVLDHLMSNNSITNMHIMSLTKEKHKLLVLINNDWVGSPSGNELYVYSLPRLEIEAKVSLSTSYCELTYSHGALLAVPYLSRQIHFLKADFGMEMVDVEVIKSLSSGHQIRRFHVNSSKNYILTYGWDGLIILRNKDFVDPVCVFESHHRYNYGVKFAVVDLLGEYILSLGKEGNLVCTKVLTSRGRTKEECKVDTSYESYFKKPGPRTGSSSFNNKTWLDTQIQQKLNIETGVAAQEIKNIMADFKILQKELVYLLDENSKAPQEEQLDILEFDLDTETREERLKEAEVERNNVQRLVEAECLDCDRLAEVIRNNTWDTMVVKSRCIKAMLRDFSVHNYGLPPNPPNFLEDLTWECESRKLTTDMALKDHYEPWFPISEDDKTVSQSPDLTTDQIKEGEEEEEVEEKENPYLLSGSSSHQFVEINPLHSNQFEICSSLCNTSEIVMLEKVCIDLRNYFNKLFDDMFLQKEKEMSLLADRNTRLRTILSELRVTCNAPMNVDEPVDAVWSQEEKTERIVTIDDSEVPEIPYISPSEQDLLDKKAAEEERIRQLLAADNFRELALIEMMDGMLEVRWEDELKKEVPKPKCLLEKEPEDYNESDLKAIKEYEDKCRILLSERERYRKMLEIEYKKLENTIQESLTKFDNSLFELFQTKLKIDAAMNHEQLKILRIHRLNDDRIRREIQEREIINKVFITEKESEFALKQVTQLQEATSECRNNYEQLVTKDKALGKKFKQEFVLTNATPAVLEQLVKYFRRRPKLHQKATQFPTLLLELARCVVVNDNTSFMPPEFHEFLVALDNLDLPATAGLHFDDAVWATLVQVRRAKIESELKVKAYAIELKEAEYTLSVVTKQMKAAKERATANVAELKATKEQKIRLSRDLQIQLVMKQGFVEAPLTGHISDFKNAILINPKIIYKMNQNVIAAGTKKLNAMKKVTKLHRINKYEEWEYKKMKMECEDLEDKLNNIQSIKVTLEVKQYLNDLGKPKERDIQDDDTALLKQTEDNYKSLQKRLIGEIKAVATKIKNFKQMNVEADKNILDLKCDVSEQQFERDFKLEETVSEASRKRMRMIVKRSQLVAKIQQVHKDNLVLQTELELLRLRTYPTLKYKAPI